MVEDLQAAAAAVGSDEDPWALSTPKEARNAILVQIRNPQSGFK